MSHEVETMAYAHRGVADVPWHGLGVAVSADLMPFEMLEEAGLDWKVEKKGLWVGPVADAENAPSPVDGHQMLVRDTDGAHLGIVSKNWEPIQNEEAFQVFVDFVDKGGMTMETAGSLRDGRLVWALAKTTEEFRVFGDDVIRGYFLFSNPHQYGQSASFGGTSIRVVCANTHSWALQSGLDNKITVSHRKPFVVEYVNEALAGLRHRLDEFQQTAELLGSVQYTDEKLKGYFSEMFPFTGKTDTETKLSRNAEEALKVIETQPGAKFAPNSWWQAYNAYTYMTDHVVGNTDANRLDSAMFGYHRRTKIKALDRAVEYARAA